MDTVSKELDRRLHDLYYNINNPTSYTSLKNLYNAIKKELPKTKIKDVKIWYEGQKTPMVWRNRVKPRRNPIIQTRLNFQVQSDLLDLNFLKSSNNGYRYILAIIDVFSRKVWVEKLKSKNAAEVSKNVVKILDELPTVSSFQSDLGSEFRNATLKKYFAKRKISLWLSQNREIKASIVERFFRTLRGRILKYITANSTKKWIHVYKNIAKNYNNSKHSSHGFAPAEINLSNAYLVRSKLYPKVNKKKQKALKMGDFVRLLRIREKFEKNTYQYTDEIFKIKKILIRSPYNVFKIEDMENEPIEGTFYAEELLKVPPAL